VPPTPLSKTSVGIATRFQVGKHQVTVWRVGYRWAVAMDEQALTNTFETQAEAWEGGVREADRLDRLGGVRAAPGRGG
jgi:hypothetical protein